MGSAVGGTLQLNVRIPRESKEAGDAVLALMGSSPTRLVRALYDKISQGAKAYEEVAAVLGVDAAAAENQADADGRHEAMSNFFSMHERFAQEMGLDLSTYVPMTDEEMEEALYEEYLEEMKGYAYD